MTALDPLDGTSTSAPATASAPPPYHHPAHLPAAFSASQQLFGSYATHHDHPHVLHANGLPFLNHRVADNDDDLVVGSGPDCGFSHFLDSSHLLGLDVQDVDTCPEEFQPIASQPFQLFSGPDEAQSAFTAQRLAEPMLDFH